MKTTIRLSLLILISFLTYESHSQDLVSVRVFFDDRTAGYQFFTLPGVQSIDQPFEVDVSGQTAGLHRLYVEVMDDQGRWSLYDSKMIQLIGGMNMATLNAIEYFFDTDPGFGEGIQIAVTGTEVSGNFDLNLTGLANGIHQLYIRVRDGDNQWSLYDKKVIHVVGSEMEEIVEAEYFFDEDPGWGLGNNIDLASLSIDADLQLEIGSLSTGVHTVYFRVKDATGIWSLHDKEIIMVTNPVGPNDLVQAEYYFDIDPGEGNAIPLVIPQQAVVDGDFQINIPSNIVGTHTVCIRVMNGAGLWSAVSCQTFTVCDLAIPEIVMSGTNCQSEPYVLAIANSGYDSIVWSTEETTSSIEITTPGEYTVTVTDNGCTTVQSIDAQFSLSDEPEITVTGPVCIDSTQILTVIGNFDSYLWPDGSTASSLAVNESGDYTVEVVTGECVKYATVSVDFFQPENPEITITGNACIGETIMLNVDATLNNIQWNTEETEASISVNSNGTYSLTAIKQGCQVEASIDVSFDIEPTFTIEASGGNCEGDQVTLSVVPDIYTYDWFNNTTSSSVQVNQSGSYSVEVINGACVGTGSYDLNLISLPQPSITSNINALACDLSGYNYQWYFNGNLIDGATSQFYQATQSGFYTVVIEDNGCTNESALFSHTYVGIEDISSEINIYPNPTSGFVLLSFSKKIDSIEILDLSGRTVTQLKSNSNQMTIDCSSFASGTYILKSVSEGQILYSRIIKT